MCNQTVQEWFIDGLEGDGRGSFFWNTDPSVDEVSGVKIIDWEGYNNDDEYDDFGYEFYQTTVVGTESQVRIFIDTHFDGVGNINN